METTETDCRSEEGITVGLIDTIITVSRVLAKRKLTDSVAVYEALRDLSYDEDVKFILSLGKGWPPKGDSR